MEYITYVVLTGKHGKIELLKYESTIPIYKDAVMEDIEESNGEINWDDWEVELFNELYVPTIKI